MENERDPEVIRRQMQQTRDHLTEKVEGVEALVTSTVKQTTDAVTETVTEVKEAVSDTVAGVKDVVEGTVEGVKSAFDFRSHIRNHPWLMLGASLGAGFLVGRLFGRAERAAAWTGAAAGTVGGAVSGYTHAVPERPEPVRTPEPHRETESGGLLSAVVGNLGPALNKIKEMGLGYTMGVVDKLVTEHLPEQWQGQVHETIDSLTTSLGGKPMKEWESSGDDRSAAYQTGPTTQY
jgi:ElaB/YqjD/DUF883 family membrane-anchored ribosome-binding protein